MNRWFILTVRAATWAASGPPADGKSRQEPVEPSLLLEPVSFRREQCQARSRTPLPVACPRCRAEPREPCNQRTLGRKRHHWARVESYRKQEEGEG
jgi:hypothetical protein